MNREKIFEKLKNIVDEQKMTSVNIETGNLTEDTSLINDLVLDSIQILEIIIHIENAFDIICDAYELNLDMFDHVGDLVDYIYKKLNNK